MNSQQLENEKQGSALALPMLDMAEIFSLVQAEARRELAPADLGLPKLHTPVTALTLSRLSTPQIVARLPGIDAQKIESGDGLIQKLERLQSQALRRAFARFDEKEFAHCGTARNAIARFG